MNKLLVTPSEVNEKAKEVTNLKEHMMSHLESIKTKIQNMTASNWVGTAGEAYMNQFIHVYNQSIAALDTLQQHANNLAQAASRYSELEDAQISEATNLDSTDFLQIKLIAPAASGGRRISRRACNEISDRHGAVQRTARTTDQRMRRTGAGEKKRPICAAAAAYSDL